MLNKFTSKSNYLVGVISDTHGRLPQSVLKAFKDVDLIIHAGDIGKENILDDLANIAPTIGVRGNMDMGVWSGQLAEKQVVSIGSHTVWVLHDIGRLETNPEPGKCQVVISGHTHRPTVEKQQDVLYLNPGSAVQPRYGYPPSVALLKITGNAIEVRLVELKD